MNPKLKFLWFLGIQIYYRTLSHHFDPSSKLGYSQIKIDYLYCRLFTKRCGSHGRSQFTPLSSFSVPSICDYFHYWTQSKIVIFWPWILKYLEFCKKSDLPSTFQKNTTFSNKTCFTLKNVLKAYASLNANKKNAKNVLNPPFSTALPICL